MEPVGVGGMTPGSPEISSKGAPITTLVPRRQRNQTHHERTPRRRWIGPRWIGPARSRFDGDERGRQAVDRVFEVVALQGERVERGLELAAREVDTA